LVNITRSDTKRVETLYSEVRKKSDFPITISIPVPNGGSTLVRVYLDNKNYMEFTEEFNKRSNELIPVILPTITVIPTITVAVAVPIILMIPIILTMPTTITKERKSPVNKPCKSCRIVLRRYKVCHQYYNQRYWRILLCKNGERNL